MGDFPADSSEADLLAGNNDQRLLAIHYFNEIGETFSGVYVPLIAAAVQYGTSEQRQSQKSNLTDGRPGLGDAFDRLARAIHGSLEASESVETVRQQLESGNGYIDSASQERITGPIRISPGNDGALLALALHSRQRRNSLPSVRRSMRPPNLSQSENMWRELTCLLKAKLLCRSFTRLWQPVTDAAGNNTRGNEPIPGAVRQAILSPSGLAAQPSGSHTRPNIAGDRSETRGLLQRLQQTFNEIPDDARGHYERVMQTVAAVLPYLSETPEVRQLVAGIPVGTPADRRYLIDSQCYMLILMAITAWEAQNNGWPNIPTIHELRFHYAGSVFEGLPRVVGEDEIRDETESQEE